MLDSLRGTQTPCEVNSFVGSLCCVRNTDF